MIKKCLIRKKYEVAVVDNNSYNINKLQNGELPIFEPDLQDLIREGINQNRLTFSTNFENIFKDLDVIYFAKDAIKTDDGVDLDDIIKSINLISDIKKESFTLIISTQLPIAIPDLFFKCGT